VQVNFADLQGWYNETWGTPAQSPKAQTAESGDRASDAESGSETGWLSYKELTDWYIGSRREQGEWAGPSQVWAWLCTSGAIAHTYLRSRGAFEARLAVQAATAAEPPRNPAADSDLRAALRQVQFNREDFDKLIPAPDRSTATAPDCRDAAFSQRQRGRAPAWDWPALMVQAAFVVAAHGGMEAEPLVELMCEFGEKQNSRKPSRSAAQPYAAQVLEIWRRAGNADSGSSGGDSPVRI